MAENRKEGEQATPKWLKTIQLNSWEAELLISALVLYALFRIPDYVDQTARLNIPRGSRLFILTGLLIEAINLLKWGYILHILVRGMWVASVGFSYVFPDGVKKSQLKFQGKFGKELEDGTLVRSVLRLEELSSIIYGLSFLLFGSMIGMGMLFFVFIMIIEMINSSGLHDTLAIVLFSLIFSIYLVSLLFLLVDFFTNGLLRRIDWTAKFFYPVAWIFRILSLSFLYRRSLLVLISNLKGWKAYMIPIFLASLIIGYLVGVDRLQDRRITKLLEHNQQISMLKQNYENHIADDTRPHVTIQSDIVAENVLRVFLNDLSIFKGMYNYDAEKIEDKKWIQLSSLEASPYLNKWITLKIDSVKIDRINWFCTQHSKSYRFGYQAYIDISSFSRGPKSISLEFNPDNLSEASNNVYKRSLYSGDYLANIYFFYDKP